MKFIAGALAALMFLGSAAAARDKDRRPYEGPIIDVHLHAYPADGNGPAPNAVCPGVAANLQYDPKTPWPAKMGALMTDPPCEDPIQGPATDAELRDRTIALMKKYKVTGVLSGPAERIADWRAAAPGLFIAGRELSLKRDNVSADEIEQEFVNGGFDVLAEVTNQYRGVLADDSAFDAYWAVAAEHDIPVGIHLGIGPPGSPMLYPDFRVQTPLQMEAVLNRHQTLRVYLMHAGFPFADDLKAMLYLYPQLYVDTGVLQLAAPREDYYAFLEEIVRAGFIDRIMFGSDQMYWPGMIEEGIEAINDAPFLTYEQKKDILHDNAARFLRLEE
ncbi:amidohydrolase family protein [Hyphococcus luteus]|uniref:Metal-dependent hydrolase n=1 Tax=Hyphococcus luteus TaxID=2058213 RepID=A0A2S7K3L6_9PROT|nr:amidohydrolase family protein [Marinicaulis flavus]PQA87095.1 metal-dependent hydrolase [Marinicaulis flavus]